MSYSISTMFVWRFFNNECECPLCKLQSKIESDLINLYLSEAVMEDDERKLVNLYGFCADHYDVMYSAKNKLGLALQVKTRLYTLNKQITLPKDYKHAKKQAEILKEKTCSCIICKRLDDTMDRYYQTIAKMYDKEEKFRKENFKQINGFCLTHYTKLLEFSSFAKSSCAEFLKEVYEKTKNYTDALYDTVDKFTFAFDYRNTKLPDKETASALKKARYYFYTPPTTPPNVK
ncbi:MAG: hypothetical protein IJW26_06430 [Clostridia bacterium]|nr:hypothetical protein [Clostridia bacterium]